MSYSIFISYRRKDSTLAVSSFFKDLMNEFNEEIIFVDTASNEPGDPWPIKIRQALEESKIVLVVISNNWLCTEDNNPQKLRLCSENDWVRQEIELAISLRKVIIPVLANIPEILTHEELPESIKKLNEYSAQPIKTTIGDNAETKEFITFLRHKLEYLNSPDDLKVLLQKSLAKKYKIDGDIGTGTKANVYRGRDTKLERNVAIKVVANPAYNSEFVDAIRMAAKIADSAPNSIAILGAYVDNDPFHVIMNFFSKGSLRKKIDIEKRFFSFEKTRNILIDIGTSLVKMHNLKPPITHCNVMPSNIILNDNDNPYLNPLSRKKIFSGDLLLSELSYAYCQVEEKVHREELCYLAPEIFDKNPIEYEKIDQYMLGLVGYELLTGGIPDTLNDFNDLKVNGINAFKKIKPITEIRNDCPEELAEVIQKMAARNPKKRYDTVEDAIDEITQISLKEFEIAQDSYRRCLRDGENGNKFFRTFYSRLIGMLPVEEAEKFKPKGIGETKSNEQYTILREAIFILLSFCEHPPAGVEPNIMTRIAEKHNKNHYNVAPDLYDFFITGLTDTVCGDSEGTEPFDSHCTNANEKEVIKEAWLKALKPGIDYMKSKYRK